jgi:hypothetical protein
MTTQSSSDKGLLRKEDCGENGTYTRHKLAKNYSTGLRKSLNSSFMTTKITTSKRSSTVLSPRPPLITPCGKLQKDLKPSLKLLHRFGRHKEHGQEPMLKKRRPSPITLPLHSNLTHLNLTPFPKTPSHHFLKPHFQLEPPIQRLKRSEVQAIIKNLPPKKSPGYELMTGKILKELPTLCLQYLTQLFNAILLRGYFPAKVGTNLSLGRYSSFVD